MELRRRPRRRELKGSLSMDNTGAELYGVRWRGRTPIATTSWLALARGIYRHISSALTFAIGMERSMELRRRPRRRNSVFRAYSFGIIGSEL